MTTSLSVLVTPYRSTLGNLGGEIGKEKYEVIRDKGVVLGLIVKGGGRGVAAPADERASRD